MPGGDKDEGEVERASIGGDQRISNSSISPGTKPAESLTPTHAGIGPTLNQFSMISVSNSLTTNNPENPRYFRQFSALNVNSRVSSSTQKRIFIPKALCLLSRYPFYDYFSEIIEDLYSATRNYMVNVVEAYINKLVLECPAPPRGLVKVKLEKYSRPGKFMELSQPPINELPFVNTQFFDTLFRNLTVDNIVQIYTHLLVEKPVIIVGSNVEYMLPIISSLSNLIHPFEIQYCLPLIRRDPDVSFDESNLMIV